MKAHDDAQVAPPGVLCIHLLSIHFFFNTHNHKHIQSQAHTITSTYNHNHENHCIYQPLCMPYINPLCNLPTRIGGTFPDAALSTMVQLQAVDITGNMFNSTLPTFVGKLPILSQALMSRNNLQGSIPPEWCRRFASVDAEVPLVVIIADNPRVCVGVWGCVMCGGVVCGCFEAWV